MLQAWQLNIIPLDAPTKRGDKLGVTLSPAQPAPAKQYGCDLPVNQPAPNRTADDLGLALCAAPADNR